MEIINTEQIVCSLLGIGFEQVDSMLFTLVLGKLSLEQREKPWFEFQDKEFSKFFETYVDSSASIFKLKDDFELASNIGPDGYHYALEFALKHQNRTLTKHIENLDYQSIIYKKLEMIGFDKYEECAYLFCEKEKSIIRNIIQTTEIEMPDILKRSLI